MIKQRGGKRDGAGRKLGSGEMTKMFFLRVPAQLFELLTVLTTNEKRDALEIAALKKKLSIEK